MEIKWRKQEMIFAGVLLAARLLTLAWEWRQSAPLPPGFDPAQRFAENGLPFQYGLQVFLPRAGAAVLVFLIYLAANRLLAQSLRQISPTRSKRERFASIAGSIAGLLALSFLLAIGINALSYLGRPHLFNYGGYHYFALFGYNDAPLSHPFFGFGKALELLFFLALMITLRELLIRYIDRPDAGREFRVYLANELTRLGFLFFLILFLFKPFHWAWVLLILCSFAWLLYRQNKEKIQALWKMEKALNRSAADLQFLRSQINPHFLFNTLNTLYGSALREKADNTATCIQMLGDMMRFMLKENEQDLIPLEKARSCIAGALA